MIYIIYIYIYKTSRWTYVYTLTKIYWLSGELLTRILGKNSLSLNWFLFECGTYCYHTSKKIRNNKICNRKKVRERAIILLGKYLIFALFKCWFGLMLLKHSGIILFAIPLIGAIP